jgi:glycosyltransferase involved in cell wall biosynthesis
MDVAMNQEAVIHFSKNIFPIIQKKIPDVNFFVVGKNPSRTIRRLNDNLNIFVTGTVIDVRPYYHCSKVAVAPFSLGGGTKLKILEAMAMRIPLVSTPIGIQGLEVINNKHLYIANGINEFAEKVSNCLTGTSTDLVNNAYSLVHKNYSWKHILKKVEEKIIQKQNALLNKTQVPP